jgi:RNA polymerase sigma-70 factor (ECF subfamily)
MRSPSVGAPDARRLIVIRGDALRARLVSRDERALEELVETMTPWLLGVATAILRDTGDAEDTVLEAFQIAWDRIGLVQDRELDLVPWLMRIARNRAIDRLRARRRFHAATARAEEREAFGERATPPQEPDESAQPGWHVHDSVHAAIAALPDDQQTTLRMAYFEGLTHSEIATRLDAPLGTVKTRLRLALNRLRVSLATLKGWNL